MLHENVQIICYLGLSMLSVGLLYVFQVFEYFKIWRHLHAICTIDEYLSMFYSNHVINYQNIMIILLKDVII